MSTRVPEGTQQVLSDAAFFFRRIKIEQKRARMAESSK
jgi:hypothetical protein